MGFTFSSKATIVNLLLQHVQFNSLPQYYVIKISYLCQTGALKAFQFEIFIPASLSLATFIFLQTREELRVALEAEMRAFNEDRDVRGNMVIAWNHLEFEVSLDVLLLFSCHFLDIQYSTIYYKFRVIVCFTICSQCARQSFTYFYIYHRKWLVM